MVVGLGLVLVAKESRDEVQAVGFRARDEVLG